MLRGKFISKNASQLNEIIRIFSFFLELPSNTFFSTKKRILPLNNINAHFSNGILDGETKKGTFRSIRWRFLDPSRGPFRRRRRCCLLPLRLGPLNGIGRRGRPHNPCCTHLFIAIERRRHWPCATLCRGTVAAPGNRPQTTVARRGISKLILQP